MPIFILKLNTSVETSFLRAILKRLTIYFVTDERTDLIGFLRWFLNFLGCLHPVYFYSEPSKANAISKTSKYFYFCCSPKTSERRQNSSAIKSSYFSTPCFLLGVSCTSCPTFIVSFKMLFSFEKCGFS